MKLKLFALLGMTVAISSAYASEDFWSTTFDSVRPLRITEVNYSWAGLSQLEVSADKCSDVETMHLGNNNFSKIPAEISTLSKLKELYLESNKLKHLSYEDLKQLKVARKVMLHNNRISSIDPSVSELDNLNELSLAYNQLTTLPVNIKNLRTTIKSLNLIGNPLQENGETKDDQFVSLGWRQLQESFGEKLLFNFPA